MSRTFPAASLLVSCRGTSASDSQTPVRAVLDLRNARDDLTTTRSPGRPRRAVVDGVELSSPTNASTSLRDRAPTARMFPTEPGATSIARFGAQVIPLLRAPGAADDLQPAAGCSAAELLPEVRALAAWHRLLPSQKVTN